VPGDAPAAADDYGTTAGEQIQGEPLDGRLSREEPEEQAVFGVGEPPGTGRQADARTAGAIPRRRALCAPGPSRRAGTEQEGGG